MDPDTSETPYQRSLVDVNVKAEILKLLLIVGAKEEPMHRSYLKEKLTRIYTCVPIALHPILQRQFNEIVEKGGGIND